MCNHVRKRDQKKERSRRGASSAFQMTRVVNFHSAYYGQSTGGQGRSLVATIGPKHGYRSPGEPLSCKETCGGASK